MPTYNNPTTIPIKIPEVGLTLYPGDNANILVIPDSLLSTKYNNVTIVNEAPFYNPLSSDISVNFSSQSDNKEVSLSPNTDYLEFYEATCLVHVYIQSLDNTPPFRVKLGDMVTLRIKSRASKIIFVPDDVGSIRISERRDEPRFEDWSKNYSQNTIDDLKYR